MVKRGASSATTSPNESKSGTKTSRVLYWFRTDLRLTDSPALCAALSLARIESFYPIWCWDPNYIYGHRVGLNRFQFLLESMQSISDELTALNPAQKLHVLRGPPEDVLPVLWKSWGITHLVFEKDSNGYAKIRDAKVMEMAEKAGVEVVGVHGRHLYDPEEVVKNNEGKGTMTLHQWQGVTSKMGKLEEVYPTPKELPGPGKTELEYDTMKLDKFTWREIDINSHIRTGKDTCYGEFALRSDTVVLECDGGSPRNTIGAEEEDEEARLKRLTDGQKSLLDQKATLQSPPCPRWGSHKLQRPSKAEQPRVIVVWMLSWGTQKGSRHSRNPLRRRRAWNRVRRY